MKQYLKMADVFDLPISDEVYRVDFAVISDSNDHMIGGFGIEGMSSSAVHAINSHDELVQMNQDLLVELKAMAKAYVNLLEAGKDRIESLGGDCDEVTYMAAHDVALVSACSVIGKHDGGAA